MDCRSPQWLRNPVLNNYIKGWFANSYYTDRWFVLRKQSEWKLTSSWCDSSSPKRMHSLRLSRSSLVLSAGGPMSEVNMSTSRSNPRDAFESPLAALVSARIFARKSAASFFMAPIGIFSLLSNSWIWYMRGEHNLTEVRKNEWLWHRALFSWHYHLLTYLRTYVLDLANRDSNPGNLYLSLSWTFSNSLVSSCESSFITSICSAKSGVTCHSSAPNCLKSRWNPLSFLNLWHLWNDFQSFGWKKSHWNPLALRPQ